MSSLGPPVMASQQQLPQQQTATPSQPQLQSMTAAPATQPVQQQAATQQTVTVSSDVVSRVVALLRLAEAHDKGMENQYYHKGYGDARGAVGVDHFQQILRGNTENQRLMVMQRLKRWELKGAMQALGSGHSVDTQMFLEILDNVMDRTKPFFGPLRSMAARLATTEHSAIVSWIGKYAGNGWLTAQNFSDMARDLEIKGHDQADWERILRIQTWSGVRVDGYIELQLFLGVLRHILIWLPIEDSMNQLLQGIFSHFDPNNAGFVTRDQIQRALFMIQPNADNDHVVRLKQAADKYHPTGPGRVHLEDFARQLMWTLEGVMDWYADPEAFVSRLSQELSACDIDHCGSLAFPELERAMHRIGALNLLPGELQELFKAMDSAGRGRVEIETVIWFLKRDLTEDEPPPMLASNAAEIAKAKIRYSRAGTLNLVGRSTFFIELPDTMRTAPPLPPQHRPSTVLVPPRDANGLLLLDQIYHAQQYGTYKPPQNVQIDAVHQPVQPKAKAKPNAFCACFGGKKEKSASVQPTSAIERAPAHWLIHRHQEALTQLESVCVVVELQKLKNPEPLPKSGKRPEILANAIRKARLCLYSPDQERYVGTACELHGATLSPDQTEWSFPFQPEMFVRGVHTMGHVVLLLELFATLDASKQNAGQLGGEVEFSIAWAEIPWTQDALGQCIALKQKVAHTVKLFGGTRRSWIPLEDPSTTAAKKTGFYAYADFVVTPFKLLDMEYKCEAALLPPVPTLLPLRVLILVILHRQRLAQCTAQTNIGAQPQDFRCGRAFSVALAAFPLILDNASLLQTFVTAWEEKIKGFNKDDEAALLDAFDAVASKLWLNTSSLTNAVHEVATTSPQAPNTGAPATKGKKQDANVSVLGAPPAGAGAEALAKCNTIEEFLQPRVGDKGFLPSYKPFNVAEVWTEEVDDLALNFDFTDPSQEYDIYKAPARPAPPSHVSTAKKINAKK
eukprot:gnl/MRDRNA2_/MRDRNA2_75415_c0_seq2.p1 gnl/MRDRNA2_/MRDRNA2_75415_c0~~gnl/MRDRNA2_/MRDRNA2_75415_c0_seq2.p1  ORF type:complete len:963 (+),score=195.36 gnl/MRDRNA2_/MRDRNA2_75415_c0_seq2:20-2908(+)